VAINADGTMLATASDKVNFLEFVMLMFELVHIQNIMIMQLNNREPLSVFSPFQMLKNFTNFDEVHTIVVFIQFRSTIKLHCCVSLVTRIRFIFSNWRKKMRLITVQQMAVPVPIPIPVPWPDNLWAQLKSVDTKGTSMG